MGFDIASVGQNTCPSNVGQVSTDPGCKWKAKAETLIARDIHISEDSERLPAARDPKSGEVNNHRMIIQRVGTDHYLALIDRVKVDVTLRSKVDAIALTPNPLEHPVWD